MKSVKVGLLGLGTIGTGVAKILIKKQEMIERAVGKKIELVKICDRNMSNDRS